jgi:tRNA-dihydrouridine synthase B
LNSAELLKIAAESGIAFATVHARTRAQGYSGNARWNDIPMPQKLPVVFNGDIQSGSDIEAVKKMGAAGAMIGRAMMGNPWVFGGVRDERLILEHFELSLEYYGEKTAVPMFRKHAAWYAAGRQGANTFRQEINKITTAEEMRRVLDGYFAA